MPLDGARSPANSLSPSSSHQVTEENMLKSKQVGPTQTLHIKFNAGECVKGQLHIQELLPDQAAQPLNL